MNKKLTKTIILIVFVVFLGIGKADAISKTCLYVDGNRNNTITIDDSFSSASIQSGSNAHGKVMNWSSNHKSGFSGYDFFEANGRICPPKLVEIRNVTSNDVYFADSNSLDAVKKYANSGNLINRSFYVYDLASELDGEGQHGDTSNNNSATKITSKTCSCNGTDKSKKISVEIKVSESLTNPRTTIKFGDASNDESIANWDEPLVTRSGFLNWNKHESTYTYKQDLISNNKCPDYALLYRGGGYFLAVSDEDNLSEVKAAIQEHMTGNGTVYTIGCHETIIDNKPSTSNKQEGTSNEYDDPTINSNVTPLSPDFDTYSCGGSYLTGIPVKIPKLTKFIYIFLQVLVPIAIIILGSLDLLKAVAAQKEDEIKKGQQVFIKRLVGAAIVFFVFAIVKFIISIVSDNSTSIINCVDCFLKNNDSCVEE